MPFVSDGLDGLALLWRGTVLLAYRKSLYIMTTKIQKEMNKASVYERITIAIDGVHLCVERHIIAVCHPASVNSIDRVPIDLQQSQTSKCPTTSPSSLKTSTTRQHANIQALPNQPAKCAIPVGTNGKPNRTNWASPTHVHSPGQYPIKRWAP